MKWQTRRDERPWKDEIVRRRCHLYTEAKVTQHIVSTKPNLQLTYTGTERIVENPGRYQLVYTASCRRPQVNFNARSLPISSRCRKSTCSWWQISTAFEPHRPQPDRSTVNVANISHRQTRTFRAPSTPSPFSSRAAHYPWQEIGRAHV